MTLRAGMLSDKGAITVYKTDHNDQFFAGAVLTGFGTKSIPGAICGDSIPRVLEFTAHHLQRVLDGLLERKVVDMDYAKQVLSVQLSKINDSINYINRNIGQGAYVSGIVSYVAEENYICLPFGGSCAYLWTGEELVQQKNQIIQYDDPLYIYDALGGTNAWAAIFDGGILPVGGQLLSMTSQPQDGVLEKTLSTLAATNPQFVADNILTEMEKTKTPNAVLAVTQAATYVGGANNDE